MIDYLIVGAGLAGISFSEVALKNNKTIFVLDNDSQNSSKIAGGLYNPVILKRFSEVWQAQAQLVLMNEFYDSLKQKINVQPVGIMPRKYLIEKHNIKVLKKKLEKAYSSHQLSKAVKEYKILFDFERKI